MAKKKQVARRRRRVRKNVEKGVAHIRSILPLVRSPKDPA